MSLEAGKYLQRNWEETGKMNTLLHHKVAALHYRSTAGEQQKQPQTTNNSITPPPACFSEEYTSFDLKYTSYCKLMMIPAPSSLALAAATA